MLFRELSISIVDLMSLPRLPREFLDHLCSLLSFPFVIANMQTSRRRRRAALLARDAHLRCICSFSLSTVMYVCTRAFQLA